MCQARHCRQPGPDDGSCPIGAFLPVLPALLGAVIFQPNFRVISSISNCSGNSGVALTVPPIHLLVMMSRSMVNVACGGCSANAAPAAVPPVVVTPDIECRQLQFRTFFHFGQRLLSTRRMLAAAVSPSHRLFQCPLCLKHQRTLKSHCEHLKNAVGDGVRMCRFDSEHSRHDRIVRLFGSGEVFVQWYYMCLWSLLASDVLSGKQQLSQPLTASGPPMPSGTVRAAAPPSSSALGKSRWRAAAKPTLLLLCIRFIRLRPCI
jgi:hypothetical protein